MKEPQPIDFAQEFISKQWCQHNIRQPMCVECLAALLKSYGGAHVQPVAVRLAELLQLVDPTDPKIAEFLRKHGLRARKG